MAVSGKKRASTSQANCSQSEKVIAEPTDALRTVHRQVEIPLPPSTIGNEEEAITKEMQRWCYQYCPELDGVLVSFDNVNFVSDHGRIKYDLPYVFWDITADFSLFEPKLNSICKGRIIRFGQSAKIVNCLVGECVTATIVIPDPTPDELVPYLKTDVEIFFRIVKINSEKLSLQACIDDECYDLLLKTEPPVVDDSGPLNMDEF